MCLINPGLLFLSTIYKLSTFLLLPCTVLQRAICNVWQRLTMTTTTAVDRYEDTETNPLAGCLPPLLQIPVFIALYRSILNLANAKALGK